MAELNRMIIEVHRWREIYRADRNYIDAAACAIRETALLDAKRAIEKQGETHE